MQENGQTPRTLTTQPGLLSARACAGAAAPNLVRSGAQALLSKPGVKSSTRSATGVPPFAKGGSGGIGSFTASALPVGARQVTRNQATRAFSGVWLSALARAGGIPLNRGCPKRLRWRCEEGFSPIRQLPDNPRACWGAAGQGIASHPGGCSQIHSLGFLDNLDFGAVAPHPARSEARPLLSKPGLKSSNKSATGVPPFAKGGTGGIGSSTTRNRIASQSAQTQNGVS